MTSEAALLQRRGLLRLTAAVATMGLAVPTRAADDAPLPRLAPAPAPVGPPADAPDTTSVGLAEAQTTWARLNGDLSGHTVYFTTQGDVWGFKPQADDIAIDDFAKFAYGYAGVAARKMQRRADGAIVVRQKSWAFYRDPETGRLGNRITNRWTGVVDTAPPLSGAAGEQVLSATGASAPAADPYHMRIRRLGAQAFVSTWNTARFKPRDTTWFKLEANMASHHCLARDLDDASLTHVPGTFSQNLVAEWQTWTKMHGQTGHILFKGDGVALLDPAAVPDELRRVIEAFFPGQWAEVGGWK